MEQCQTPLTKRGYERHERILEAAGEVFAEQGYAGASINEIVRRSGGSLGTVYKFFGNKLGLFEAYFRNSTPMSFGRIVCKIP
ncbi:TetR/AcrR family transcriptional regulator [Thiomicrospira pelophila]|uniref:TetR/AcrR family transcriptional regulator n=1 Tax=Thiomicrospira pelophila TaxID=934 RepID=UPI0004A6E136|nr:TetR/AcrR family transcriptional regulator [Thiomicrospira pelophila]